MLDYRRLYRYREESVDLFGFPACDEEEKEQKDMTNELGKLSSCDR